MLTGWEELVVGSVDRKKLQMVTDGAGLGWVGGVRGCGASEVWSGRLLVC